MNLYTKAELKYQLRRHEGWKNKPYRCTAGKLTIGVGRNLDDTGLYDDEIDYLLDNDISRREAELIKKIPVYLELSPVRQAALVDMSFMGIKKLLDFKRMLAALERHDYEAAAQEALASKWARDVGPGRAQRVATELETGMWVA